MINDVFFYRFSYIKKTQIAKARPFLYQYKQTQIITQQIKLYTTPSLSLASLSSMDHQTMITTNKNNNNILKRLNKDSQTILSKNKPHVRIIHIFAPEIIKTDPSNFRELVQRLTGKPTVLTTSETMIGIKTIKKTFTKNDDTKRTLGYGRSVERVKREEEVEEEEEAVEIWRPTCSSSGDDHHNDESGGFLKEFADIDDVFIQEFGYLQSCIDQNNPFLMHHYNHCYIKQQKQHQQQQYYFVGDEDYTDTDHNRII